MMAPTVNGTMNVLKACSAMSVQKLIVVSSGAAITLNPNWPLDKLKDEDCWSDKEFCKENEVSNDDYLRYSCTKSPERLIFTTEHM